MEADGGTSLIWVTGTSGSGPSFSGGARDAFLGSVLAALPPTSVYWTYQ